ncbi:VanZ family protein [Luteimicrobium sp. NPDC057192]|uniref:VanZ family protein n=1 Tax=Luteimicrobium sp. NPDC057192 TaxID=3346042 RepID=UPI0036458C26
MTAGAVVGGRADTRTRPWLVALFGVYLVLLVWLVLWKLDVPWVGSGARRTVKLVPFVATDQNGPSKPSEVLGNVLVFVPFGVYLGLLAPRRAWWWTWARALGVVALTSAALEAAQYVLAVGSTDVSDVLANTAGGVAGLVVVALVRLVLRGRTAAVLTGLCAVGTAVALLATAAFVTSPVRYGSAPDGAGQHRQLDRPPLDAPG